MPNAHQAPRPASPGEARRSVAAADSGEGGADLRARPLEVLARVVGLARREDVREAVRRDRVGLRVVLELAAAGQAAVEGEGAAVLAGHRDVGRERPVVGALREIDPRRGLDLVRVRLARSARDPRDVAVELLRLARGVAPADAELELALERALDEADHLEPA